MPCLFTLQVAQAAMAICFSINTFSDVYRRWEADGAEGSHPLVQYHREPGLCQTGGDLSVCCVVWDVNLGVELIVIIV